MDPLTLSVGIGLAVGLLFVEFFGLSAGGMVVPGYIALNLFSVGTILLTLATSLVVFLTIRLLSSVTIIFGRRRVALTILIAFLYGVIIRSLISDFTLIYHYDDYITVIGYIIPGLISLSMDRQGVIETLTTLLTGSVVVRLLLILILGSELIL